jgi:hypothetical protein
MSGVPFDSNLPVPNGHMEVLYRQTYNSIGQTQTLDFTQSNTTANAQAIANTIANGGRLSSTLGILAGSIVAAISGQDNVIGPCAGDSTTVFDKALGIAINDAVGNPFESSSGIASQRVVYCHGTGTVFKTDIYEYYQTNGSTPVTYNAGDLMYASQNGLLTNASGLANSATASTAGTITKIGILLKAPAGSSDPYMMVQMKI